MLRTGGLYGSILCDSRMTHRVQHSTKIIHVISSLLLCPCRALVGMKATVRCCQCRGEHPHDSLLIRGVLCFTAVAPQARTLVLLNAWIVCTEAEVSRKAHTDLKQYMALPAYR